MNTALKQCRVYLHPAVVSNPNTIKKIQTVTGLQAIVRGSFIQLKGVAV